MNICAVSGLAAPSDGPQSTEQVALHFWIFLTSHCSLLKNSIDSLSKNFCSQVLQVFEISLFHIFYKSQVQFLLQAVTDPFIIYLFFLFFYKLSNLSTFINST